MLFYVQEKYEEDLKKEIKKLQVDYYSVKSSFTENLCYLYGWCSALHTLSLSHDPILLFKIELPAPSPPPPPPTEDKNPATFCAARELMTHRVSALGLCTTLGLSC